MFNLNYTGFTGVYAGSRILRRDNGGNLTPDGTHGNVASPEITRTGLQGSALYLQILQYAKVNLI